jgi:hypothetical protein
MPFTPFHMGPGMAVKAAAPRHFSIIVFGLTQIAFDLEVFWYLVQGGSPLHRFWHSYSGATILAGVLTIVGKPASQWIKTVWNRIAIQCCDTALTVRVRTTWTASFTGAIIGAYSHILLDSLFHPDVESLQPWSANNPLYGVIAPHVVEIGCVLLGVAGLACFIWRERKQR